MNETCSIRGCDRLASGAPDTDGDLCGVHRDAEFALGRAPNPRPICGANVDRCDGITTMGLVCYLREGHSGDHNTASDGSGDAFPRLD